MVPFAFVACLYDILGSRSILYSVDEGYYSSETENATDGLQRQGAKMLLDNISMAYRVAGERVGRPKSPPAWDSASMRIFFVVDIDTGASMGLRYVRVNAGQRGATGSWAINSVLDSGILWRGSSVDSTNYHSMVYMSSSFGGALVAACSAPSNCPEHLSLVSFTGTMEAPSDRSSLPSMPGKIIYHVCHNDPTKVTTLMIGRWELQHQGPGRTPGLCTHGVWGRGDSPTAADAIQVRTGDFVRFDNIC